MRNGIVILAVLISTFLAIGYAGISDAQNATSNATISIVTQQYLYQQIQLCWEHKKPSL